MEAKKLIAEVRRIVSENPEFIYFPPTKDFPNCRYVWEGKPSCLIGQGMANIGFDITALSEFDIPSVDNTIENMLINFGITFSEQELDWIIRVQGEQDNRNPWEICLMVADDSFPLT